MTTNTYETPVQQTSEKPPGAAAFPGQPPAGAQRREPPKEEPRKKEPPKEEQAYYTVALFALMPAVPAIGLVITALAFYGVTVWWLPGQPYNVLTFAIGIVITIVLWLVAAIFYRSRTSAARANPRHFGPVMAWHSRFKQRCTAEEERMNGMTRTHGWWSARMALSDAEAACTAIDKAVEKPGAQWVSQSAYLQLENYRHQAEEAWIECGPVEEVPKVALAAQRRLQGSRIANSDQLIQQLKVAVKSLGPAAQPYAVLMRAFPDEGTTATPDRSATRLGEEGRGDGKTSISGSMLSEAALPIPEPVEIQARATVREVVSTINRYREGRFTKLVAARNQLLVAAALIGLATYLMATMAILWRWNTPTILPSGIFWPDMFLGAMTLYLFGASFGLLYRLYGESTTKRAVDDYGLSLIRLVTSPVFSGFAAVAGVLLYYLVLIYTGGGGAGGSGLASAQVAEVFNLAKYPVDFLIAAIFGLTPNLIIKYLQQQTKQYIGDLESSEKADTSAETGE